MEDLDGATKLKIHRRSCWYYQRHLRTPLTYTTKWHQVNDLTSAKQTARELSKKYKKGWKLAKCCMRDHIPRLSP